MRQPDWQTSDGAIRLYCGDCLELLPELEPGSVDAVVTDPPYNVGCKYVNDDDCKTREDYEAWCSQWFTECRRISKRTILFPGHGNLFMWGRIEYPKGVGCWYKPGNPAAGGVFQFCEWEPWLVYGSGIRIGLSDTIRCSVFKQADTGDHPCPKPLRLMERVLERVKKARVILDPFLGSGTTGVACVRTGRKFIGIELERKYFDIACKRIEAELNRHPLLEQAPQIQRELLDEVAAWLNQPREPEYPWG